MPCPVAATLPKVLRGIALLKSCWRRAAHQTWARSVLAATRAQLESWGFQSCVMQRLLAAPDSLETWSWIAVNVLNDHVCNNCVLCLSLIIFMQSAQLDQNAATLDLTADVNPSPPMDIGKFTVICAASVKPHGCIVTFCELEGLFWRDNAPRSSLWLTRTSRARASLSVLHLNNVLLVRLLLVLW